MQYKDSSFRDRHGLERRKVEGDYWKLSRTVERKRTKVSARQRKTGSERVAQEQSKRRWKVQGRSDGWERGIRKE